MKQYDIDKLIDSLKIWVGEEEKEEYIRIKGIRESLKKANKMGLIKRLGGVYRG